ncbi:hypothetical protein Ccrd_006192 [Cynara cardunculus var. scolymus]|uniref:Cytochrome c oxidase subunit 5C n=2 Tax=Cynara cardunculus var. scolymus TaxID=59895 RepID=A0A124SBU8_CYNCS|nr:hypothetical protein Ccrd_006192 [Cynara cardunculus var. scolymus]
MALGFVSTRIHRDKRKFQQSNYLFQVKPYLDFLPCLLNNGTAQSIMVGGRVAHPVLKGPSVVKELVIGAVLGLAAGGLWKMHHWNEQRKTRAFYDLLEKGEISVVVEEE